MKQPSLIEAIDLYREQVERFDPDYTSAQRDADFKWKILKAKVWYTTNLTLGDFIACKDGKPLEKPYYYDEWVTKTVPMGIGIDFKKNREYQQALDRVIYAGWELRWNGPAFTSIEHKDVGVIEFNCDGTIEIVSDFSFNGTFKTRNDMTGFELTETGAKIYK